MGYGSVRKLLLPASLFLLGLTGLLGVVLLDQFYWQTGINYEGAPDLSPSHLVRSIMILLSVVLLFTGIRGTRAPQLELSEGHSTLLVWASTVGILFLALLFPVMLIASPGLFNTLSMEDGPVESLSVVLYFFCALIFTLICIRCHRSATVYGRGCWVFAVPAVVFFVLGMEEISWFQRQLDIETFGIFKDNEQEEINLHNFYTEVLETAYYFAAFLFLVVLPFIRAFYPVLAANRYLAILLPLQFISVVGAIACAYNYDMWNIVFIQIAFFGSIVILWIMARHSGTRSESVVLGAAIVVMVTTQALFLLGGDNLVRVWEVTEYRELFIPLALFFYSLGVYGQVVGVNLASVPAGMTRKHG